MIVTKKEKERIVFEKKALLYSSIFSIFFMMGAIAFAIYSNHLIAAGNALLFLLVLGAFSFVPLNNLYKDVKNNFPHILIEESN